MPLFTSVVISSRFHFVLPLQNYMFIVLLRLFLSVLLKVFYLYLYRRHVMSSQYLLVLYLREAEEVFVPSCWSRLLPACVGMSTLRPVQSTRHTQCTHSDWCSCTVVASSCFIGFVEISAASRTLVNRSSWVCFLLSCLSGK